MATQNIQLKDGNGNLLMPKTNESIINYDNSDVLISSVENRYNGTSTGGYVTIQNGAVVVKSSGGWYHTEKIDVSDVYKIVIPYQGYRTGVWMKEDNTPISELSWSDATNTPKHLIVPSGAKYFQGNRYTGTGYDYYVNCYVKGDGTILNKKRYIRSTNILSQDGNVLPLDLSQIVGSATGESETIRVDKYTTVNTTHGGYLNASQSGGVYTVTITKSSSHYHTDFIDIHGGTSLTTKADIIRDVVWYDANKTPIGFSNGSGTRQPATFSIPANAYYARVNTDNINWYIYIDYVVETYNLGERIKVSSGNVNITELKPYSGKKVAWYGTSIPDGNPYQDTQQDVYSYANRAVTELGGVIQNRCVSGGFLISALNSAYTGNQTLRFTDVDNSAEYYSPKNYMTEMVDLIGTDEEPDFFVFDYGVNDAQFYTSHINSYDLNNLDMSSEDPTTFIGAYNCVINALLTAKPKARIFMVTHYSDDAASVKDYFYKLNRLIEKIAEFWHIPCNRVYDKTGWITNRNGISNLMSQWAKDGIHPASSANVASIEFLTKIHKQFLLENYCY